MQPTPWPYKYFSREECARACESPEQVELVSPTLLKTLDAFRDLLGAPIIFSPAPGTLYAKSGHAEDSEHGDGEAGDIKFPKTGISTALLTATRFPFFASIGVYPLWKPYPGLHVGVRYHTNIFRKMWWKDETGNWRGWESKKSVTEFWSAMVKCAERRGESLSEA